MTGNDHGIWRRLLLVPFTQRFEGEKIDKRLPEKLTAESRGILAWLVRGCIAWQHNGFQPPAIVTEATDAYRSSEDVIGRCFADQCSPATNGSIKFSGLYSRLEQWTEDTGDSCPKKYKVGTWLVEQGYTRYSANGRCYRGLTLNTHFLHQRNERNELPY